MIREEQAWGKDNSTYEKWEIKTNGQPADSTLQRAEKTKQHIIINIINSNKQYRNVMWIHESYSITINNQTYIMLHHCELAFESFRRNDFNSIVEIAIVCNFCIKFMFAKQFNC